MKFLKPISFKKISYILESEIIIKSESYLNNFYGLSDFFSCSEKEIIVFNNPKYLKFLEKSKAGLIILKKKYEKYSKKNCIITENTRLALSKLLKLCYKNEKNITGFKESIFIDKNSIIASNSKICGNVIIGKNTIIKENSFISSGVTVGNYCVIGKNCFIGSNSSINDNVIIGNRSSIGSNSTIGNDGFGFVKNTENEWQKIEHLSSVIIGEDVSIGNNTTIDKGVLLNTIISDKVLIDSNIHIAHNVFIGKNSAIAGSSGIGGSTYIGKNCMIGGGVMISDHIFINDEVFITGASTVTKSINQKGIYSSTLPVKNAFLWNKNLHYINNISKILKKK